MRLTYRIIEESDGFVAECVESDAAGEGKTEEQAVESLRRSLQERMFRPDAVAPPSESSEERIELTRASEKEETKSLDLGGPGDAPAPSASGT